MTEPEAIQKALDARPRFDVPTTYSPREAQKRYIEIVRDGKGSANYNPSPGPVRDLVAWVVTLGHKASTVEFAIDDQTTEIVRFSASRGAVLSDGVGTSTDEVQP